MRASRPRTSHQPGRANAGLAPGNLHEVFRYEKGGRLRVYSLRHRGESTELWITAGNVGRTGQPSKRATLHDADDLPLFLVDIEQTLRLGGWRRLTV